MACTFNFKSAARTSRARYIGWHWNVCFNTHTVNFEDAILPVFYFLNSGQLIEKVTQQQWTSNPIKKFLYLQSKPVTSSVSLSQARHRVRQQTEKTRNRKKGHQKGSVKQQCRKFLQIRFRIVDGSLSPNPFIIQTGFITCGSMLRTIPEIQCLLLLKWRNYLATQLSSRLWQSPK